jgi:hypothetical protein
MTKEQENYIEWLDDILQQAGFMSIEDREEAIENLKNLFLTDEIPELEYLGNGKYQEI